MRIPFRAFGRTLLIAAVAAAVVSIAAPDASAAKKKKAKAKAKAPATQVDPTQPIKDSVKTAEQPKPAAPAKAAEPAPAKLDVTDLWMSKCKTCHGADGKGKPDKTEDMTAAAWQKRFTDAQIRKAIADGFEREKDGKTQKMKSFKDFTPAQLDGMVAHVRALAK